MLFAKPGFQKATVFNVPEGSNVHPCTALPFNHDRSNNQQGCNFHNTQKPLDLMGYLLMLYTNPGDLILDSFAGSGTTLLASMVLNRRFIGIERDEKFYRIACKRLEEAWQKKLARRRLTYLTFSSNQGNDNPAAPEVESAVPPASESEEQNCEALKPAEESLCHAE